MSRITIVYLSIVKQLRQCKQLTFFGQALKKQMFDEKAKVEILGFILFRKFIARFAMLLHNTHS